MIFKCPDECQKELEVEVHQSAAGYYIGTWCNNCGPVERFSSYYKTREEASKDLHIYKSFQGIPFWRD